jgi:hypothetical protein
MAAAAPTAAVEGFSANDAARNAAQEAAGVAKTDQASTGGASSQPAAQPTAAAQPTPASDQAAQAQRLIIYTTSLTILVQDLFAGVTQVSAIATSVGGFVAGVEQHVQAEDPSAIVILKVPAKDYEAVMNRLRANGIDARDEVASTQDVTEEYSDLQTQLTSLEATYTQYVELMKRTTTVEEILALQARMDEVKLQIDRIKGRSNFLATQAAMATITVTLRPAAVVLVQEYTVLAGEQRRLQVQQNSLLDELKRAATPEQEDAIRQQLNAVILQLQQVTQRLDAVQQKAAQHAIQLPTDDLALQVESGQQRPSGAELADRYVNLRVQVRAKELEQQDLLRQLRQVPAPPNADDLRRRLQQSVLELQTLNEDLQAVQERARKETITLPDVDPGILTALVGGTDLDTLERQRFWTAVSNAFGESLDDLYTALLGLATFLARFWWLLLLVAAAAAAWWRTGRKRPPFGRRAAPAPAGPAAP